MKYTLIDCTKDFEVPTQFLTPVSASTEADGILEGSGQNYFSFYEEGLQKTYNLILSQPEQSYLEVCGEIIYEMELVDIAEFEEVFLKEGFSIFMDPSLATAGPYFTTSINWTVHNDFYSYNLG